MLRLAQLRDFDKLAVQAGAMSSRGSRSLRSLLLAILCALGSLRPRPDFSPLASIIVDNEDGEKQLMQLVVAELRVEAKLAAARLSGFEKGKVSGLMLQRSAALRS